MFDFEMSPHFINFAFSNVGTDVGTHPRCVRKYTLHDEIFQILHDMRFNVLFSRRLRHRAGRRSLA